MKFEAGTKVRFTNWEEHASCPKYYPPVGTVGEVLGTARECSNSLWVQWPKGSTALAGQWLASIDDLEIVTEEDAV